MADLPSPQYLQECLQYDPETGHLFWRHNPGFLPMVNARLAGRRALASPNRGGYLRGSFKERTVSAHRVIWAMIHGEWPVGQIDHINHDRTDNRIGNLRAVSCKENQRNRMMTSLNTSGRIGITWHKKCKKWQVTIGQKYVGVFGCFQEATAARAEAERDNGYHVNHGRAVS